MPVLFPDGRDPGAGPRSWSGVGADDYMVKALRLLNFWRACASICGAAAGEVSPVSAYADLELDLMRRRVLLAPGKRIDLTGNEIRAAGTAVAAPGRVLPRSGITLAGLGYEPASDSNVIEVTNASPCQGR